MVAHRPFRGVLGRENNRVRGNGLTVHVAQRHLALGVRPQIGHHAVTAHDGLLLHEAVRVVNRGGHQCRGFVTGKTKHQALVACALGEGVVVFLVHALLDVLGLLVIAHENRAALVVDAVFGIVVADAL